MLEPRRSFHQELENLEQKVLKMGVIASEMFKEASKSLQDFDSNLADAVVYKDDQVDELEQEIETKCIRLLALQQPVGHDLRAIETSLKVITDIERIADYAVDIAKIARKLAKEPIRSDVVTDTGPLSEIALTMVSLSLKSLVERDVVLAAQICEMDDRADDQFKKIRNELLTYMPQTVLEHSVASYMLLAAVCLERVADHATNIAERVYYRETAHKERLSTPQYVRDSVHRPDDRLPA